MNNLFSQNMKTSLQFQKVVYHCLNLFSGFLELGGILFMILKNEPIQAIIAAGLAYQIGILISTLVAIPRKSSALIAAVAVIAVAGYQLSGADAVYLVILCLFSLMIQEARQGLVAKIAPEKVSVFTKRFFRILGFLLAGLISQIALLAVCLLAAVIFVLLPRFGHDLPTEIKHKVSPKVNFLSMIMVVHQSHYFSYAYLLPILFVKQLNIPVYLCGVCFMIGWLSYIFSEKLFGKLDLRYVFILGHLFAAGSLALIGFFHTSTWVVLAGWFLSGLGGGSIFCLKRMNSKTLQPSNLDFWENVGHVCGTIVSLFLAALLISNYHAIFWISAVLAIVTASLMSIHLTSLSRSHEPSDLPDGKE
jgi:hypothetical protein